MYPISYLPISLSNFLQPLLLPSLSFSPMYSKSFHSTSRSALVDIIIISIISVKANGHISTIMLFKLSAELDLLACSFLFSTLVFFWLERHILQFFYIMSSSFISFTLLPCLTSTFYSASGSSWNPLYRYSQPLFFLSLLFCLKECVILTFFFFNSLIGVSRKQFKRENFKFRFIF